MRLDKLRQINVGWVDDGAANRLQLKLLALCGAKLPFDAQAKNLSFMNSLDRAGSWLVMARLTWLCILGGGLASA